MKNLKYILPFVIVAITLISCGPIRPLTVSKIENVKIKEFSSSAASIEVTMVVKNPNNYRFKMVDNHFDLYLNKADMGRVNIKEKIIIPRKSEQPYTFVIETQFSKLAMGSIPSLINMFTSKQVELKLAGNVKVRAMFISKRFPIEITEIVPFSRKKN
ncbi:MAG: LEA type 2 family protein [Bacteroidetes bacterium]|nr:LEA type 2 family protein [Bacteroidota bacterium]